MKLGLSCEIENTHLSPHILLFTECWFFFTAVEKFIASCFAQRYMYLEYALLNKPHVYCRLRNTHNGMAGVKIGYASSFFRNLSN
jgi:hypothetical protein